MTEVYQWILINRCLWNSIFLCWFITAMMSYCVIKINCKQIKQISKIRYLGVIFDENLKWNHRICNLVGKLRSTIYQFIELRVLSQAQTMRLIYFSFYQSIFEHGLLVWGGIRYNYLKPLQVNSNYVVRIILGKKSLEGSTKWNNNLLGVLLTKQSYIWNMP